MKSEHEWRKREEELRRMQEERDQLNAQIDELRMRRNLLSYEINKHAMCLRQHRRATENIQKTRLNSRVFLMFGKKLKDLTPDEYRAYIAASQRYRRALIKQTATGL